MPARRAAAWRFVVAAPPREVYAVMEQAIGTPPFRYEILGEDGAQIVEFMRNSLVGHWRRVDGGRRVLGRMRPAVRDQRWVRVRAEQTAAGTVVEMSASRGRGALPRALQLIGIVSGGVRDPRTVYRSRLIPPGPVTLVASWAGMGYPLHLEPHRDSPRGTAVRTATDMVAIDGGTADFVHVRLADGTEGYIDRDQVVAAPEVATRHAGLAAAADR
ncbi:MAG: hypothetical protein ACYDAC_08840 [Candidatus Dormibacteria bacterium]